MDARVIREFFDASDGNRRYSPGDVFSGTQARVRALAKAKLVEPPPRRPKASG